MADIIPLARPANSDDAMVWYDIAVCHHADGTVETWTKGIDSSTPCSRKSAADALRAAASAFDQPEGSYSNAEENPDAPEAKVRRLAWGWM